MSFQILMPWSYIRTKFWKEFWEDLRIQSKHLLNWEMESMYRIKEFLVTIFYNNSLIASSDFDRIKEVLELPWSHETVIDWEMDAWKHVVTDEWIFQGYLQGN